MSQWSSYCPKKLSLAERGLDLLEKLRQSGVGQRPVVFVGHSMGGLLAKSILVQAEQKGYKDFVQNIKGFAFISTPHHGSSLANMNWTAKMVFFPSTEFSDLEVGSRQLTELHERFLRHASTRDNLQFVSFGETRATVLFGRDVIFVPQNSSRLSLGTYHEVDTNHMNICKPLSKDSLVYQKILCFVKSILFE